MGTWSTSARVASLSLNHGAAALATASPQRTASADDRDPARAAHDGARSRRRRGVDGHRGGIDDDPVVVSRALERHVVLDDIAEHRLRIALPGRAVSAGP